MTSHSHYQDKTSGYFAAARPEMLAFVPDGAFRVLDIGCGDGSFGASLKQLRPRQVTGIEHVPEIAEIAKTRLDRVLAVDIEGTLPFAEGEFDCIVANDILEHLVDPWTTVKRLVPLLQPGGHLVASIPNVRHYKVLKALIQDKTWEYSDKGVLDRTHLRFFTHRTIPPLFESAGLVVERLEGINGRKRYPFKYAILNWLTLGGLEDARFLQFACVCRKSVR